jgi:hypothetical protein
MYQKHTSKTGLVFLRLVPSPGAARILVGRYQTRRGLPTVAQLILEDVGGSLERACLLKKYYYSSSKKEE